MSFKKEYILNGLSCAHCASKMETAIAKLDYVNNANVNFATKMLTIQVDDKFDKKELFNQISSIIVNIESDVKIQEKSNDTDKNNTEKIISKNKIIQLSVGFALFLVGVIFNFTYWIEFAVFFTSYAIIGFEVVFKAIKNMSKGQFFDENFLMSLATVGAFAISEFPEAVAVMLFYQIGELFQDIAVNRSRKSITALMDIRPDFANIRVGKEIKTVSPDEVRIADIIVIKPGEKVPLDARVIDGSSMMDTSALTGESVPRKADTDDIILSGSINLNGVLTAEVLKEFSESTVSKILDLVQNASSKKARTENFITKFAKYYTPAVVFFSLALAIIPPLFTGDDFSEWINRALVFLVVSCPCALVISIPLSFFGGIGGASRNGILIKGSNYLEALYNVETVVFDKTGTLTKGVFNVTNINNKTMSKDELLEITAYAEYFSNHPIATSIKKYYAKSIDEAAITDYKEISGNGISAKIHGKTVLAGNNKLMMSENISYEEADSIGTVVHIALGGQYLGNIIISDEIKSDSAKAIEDLHKLGIKRTVMLTGDNKSVSEKVAKELKLNEIYTDLLPDQKVEKLEALMQSKTSKGATMFVGDGINDAPVLMRADIGVAMGGLGSDAAIEAADIVLMTDEPSKLVTAVQIAKRTRRIVWQNIIFALGIKAIVLILGAGGIATMWEAVFADVGVAVIAILNSMRVMNYKK